MTVPLILGKKNIFRDFAGLNSGLKLRKIFCFVRKLNDVLFSVQSSSKDVINDDV